MRWYYCFWRLLCLPSAAYGSRTTTCLSLRIASQDGRPSCFSGPTCCSLRTHQRQTGASQIHGALARLCSTRLLSGSFSRQPSTSPSLGCGSDESMSNRLFSPQLLSALTSMDRGHAYPELLSACRRCASGIPSQHFPVL